MKRNFLTELGLDDEQVTKVMAEHGKTVNSLKNELDKVDEYKSQIEDLNNQLKDRDDQLKELGEKAKDNEELNNRIKELQDQNKDTAKEYQEKLDKQAFEFKLERALTDAKAKNTKAVKALLDLDTIKLDGDSLVGLKEQLENIQKDNDYLFGEGEKLGGREPHPPSDPKPIEKNPFSKEHFNLTEQARLYKEDPELYNKLKSQI